MNDVGSRLGSIGDALASVGSELVFALSDLGVWPAIAAGLGLVATCSVFGMIAVRKLGLIGANSAVGEQLAVGLGFGLVSLGSTWAALASRGGSSFTPIAVALAVAIVWTLKRGQGSTTAPSRRSFLVPALTATAMIVTFGLLYGATLAPSPRAGVQPIEFFDVAFYSVLGQDLARTGVETIYSPSGFADLPALPAQNWYHWGEIWLAAAVMSVTDIEPILARHYVVLPVLLLAAAGLSGAIVRRLTGTASRGAFVLGAGACLLLAPLPIPYPGPYFTNFATGLVFGITNYGMGAVVVLLSLYLVATAGSLPRSWPTAIAASGVVASLLPSHLVLAVLGLIGVVIAAGLRVTQSSTGWRTSVFVRRDKQLVSTVVITLVTAAWGLMTGHQLGASGQLANVSPFDSAWLQTVIRTVLGGGLLLAIPVAALALRTRNPALATISFGTAGLVTAGALLWGARLGDFNMFHAYFGAIAVFGPPVATAAALAAWHAARDSNRRRLAAGIFVLCGVQIGFGAITAMVRLQNFGPPNYQPIPLTVLRTISELPPGAKLAYSCQQNAEPSFWEPSLVSITAHTDRQVVPMCFQADFFTSLVTGLDGPPGSMSPFFVSAPQRAIYPDASAKPTTRELRDFFAGHNIQYIYADSDHPNHLLPDAATLASSGGAEVMRIRSGRLEADRNAGLGPAGGGGHSASVHRSCPGTSGCS